jgi:nucleosome binding factor SPN SPT16 subunit
MAEEQIVINANTFFDRLSHFYASWKADKRSGGDALFGGVGSIAVIAGKALEESSYQKHNALHVRQKPAAFPTSIARRLGEMRYG